MLEKVQFEGRVKPSLNERLVIVKCFDGGFDGSRENVQLRRMYLLPQANTNFKFWVPKEYTDKYDNVLDGNSFSVEVKVIKNSETPEIVKV
jgi:hypothetical protein